MGLRAGSPRDELTSLNCLAWYQLTVAAPPDPAQPLPCTCLSLGLSHGVSVTRQVSQQGCLFTPQRPPPPTSTQPPSEETSQRLTEWMVPGSQKAPEPQHSETGWRDSHLLHHNGSCSGFPHKKRAAHGYAPSRGKRGGTYSVRNADCVF